jgi:hypothetical protein
LVHPLLQDVQLGLAHRSFQPQEQPVVVLGGVVHPVQVGDERSEQRAQLQQPVPVGVGARQARDLDPEDEPDVAKADLGHQALEAGASLSARPRFALVVVDDQHPRRRPPTRPGAVDEPVLQAGGLLVLEDLLRG